MFSICIKAIKNHLTSQNDLKCCNLRDSKVTSLFFMQFLGPHGIFDPPTSLQEVIHAKNLNFLEGSSNGIQNKGITFCCTFKKGNVQHTPWSLKNPLPLKKKRHVIKRITSSFPSMTMNVDTLKHEVYSVGCKDAPASGLFSLFQLLVAL